MWDRDGLSSLLTLLVGVAAAMVLIAAQPEPPAVPEAPRAAPLR